MKAMLTDNDGTPELVEFPIVEEVPGDMGIPNRKSQAARASSQRKRGRFAGNGALLPGA
jgi:hypothetical protein